ncbi:MAG: hypothetical protein AB1589_04215 [Cyanobacteriota bacterium]
MAVVTPRSRTSTCQPAASEALFDAMRASPSHLQPTNLQPDHGKMKNDVHLMLWISLTPNGAKPLVI